MRFPRCFLYAWPIILSASQLPFDVGVIDGSALSVKIGAVSALLALPAAASIAFLFRLRELELAGSDTRQRRGCSGGEFQPCGSPEKVWLCGCCLGGRGGGVPAWFEVLNHTSFSAKLQGCFENTFPCSLPFLPHRCAFSNRQITRSPSLDPTLAP